MSSVGQSLAQDGLNPGGSAGRRRVVHKGFSNTRGGPNLKGSQRRNLFAGFFKGGPTGFRFLNPQGQVANVRNRDKLAALRRGEFDLIQNPFRAGLIEWKPKDVSAPAFVGGPPKKPLPSFQNLLAARPDLQNQFLIDLQNLRTQRDTGLAPLEAQRRALMTALPRTGLTPFQTSEFALRRQQGVDRSREAFESAAAGLLNSGARDVGLGQLRGQQEQELIDLDRRLGAGALSSIAQQMANQQLAFAQQQVPLFLQTAAQARQGSIQELQNTLNELLSEREQRSQQFNEVFGVNF